MKYIRCRPLIYLVIIMFLCLPIAFAEPQEIIAEGTYNMGDGETPSNAERMALEKAKRTAIEQAGTYVQSYTRTKNYILTDDEVKTIASGIMQVTVINKQRLVVGDGFKFWVKIRALITTDNIELIAGRLKNDPTIDKYGYREIDKESQTMTVLKQQLALTKNTRIKDDIRNQIADKEKFLNATLLFEDGNKQKMVGLYEPAIDFYTRAIALNNNYARAYLNRGQSYMLLQQNHFAQEDFATALHLNSELFLAHWYLGCIYDQNGYDRQALDEYQSFVASATREYSENIEQAYRRITYYERFTVRDNIIHNNNSNFGSPPRDKQIPIRLLFPTQNYKRRY